jgi:uncharacterized protein with HEPN domain
MSDLRRDLDYLLDIEDAIHHAIAYSEGISWEEYIEDRKTQDAVLRNLEVLGEAAKKSALSSVESTPIFLGKKWQGQGIDLSITISV